MILSNGQYLLPSTMNYIMMDEMLIAKVYLNSEEDEEITKKALHSFGTIIGYCQVEPKKGETGIKYLLEPIDYRIDVVDKYIEAHNVTWTEDHKEFVDEKPEYLRQTTDRECRKMKNLHL